MNYRHVLTALVISAVALGAAGAQQAGPVQQAGKPAASADTGAKKSAKKGSKKHKAAEKRDSVKAAAKKG
jgi:hypothetical protein